MKLQTVMGFRNEFASFYSSSAENYYKIGNSELCIACNTNHA